MSARLPSALVVEVRRRVSSGETQSEVARALGLYTSVVNRWVNGERRRSLSAKRQDYVAVFWSRVERTSSCWNWAGSLSACGYGQFRFGDKQRRVHRLAWTLKRGPIPVGLWVLHHCDNRRCVNPAHLYLGTAQDNADDRVRRGRATFKPRARACPEDRRPLKRRAS